MSDQGPFMKKELYCPVCVYKIPVLKPRVGSSKPVKRDSDFHILHSGVNPLFYEVVVCPQCFYAAYELEFRQIKEDETRKIRKSEIPVPEELKGVPYTNERELPAAIGSYRLAVRSYSHRVRQDETIAGLYLRLAWLHRETGNEEKEKPNLAKAAEFYEKSFSSQRVFKSPLGEPGLLYLVGELHRRVGNREQAVQWLSRCISNPGIKVRPELENMARDQWMELKKQTPPA